MAPNNQLIKRFKKLTSSNLLIITALTISFGYSSSSHAGILKSSKPQQNSGQSNAQSDLVEISSSSKDSDTTKPKATKKKKNNTQEPGQPKAVPETEEYEHKAGQETPYSDEAIRHFNRGVELHQAGFFNQAIGEYKAAITADSRIEEAYSNLGILYAQQRNYPRAKEAFSEALKLKNNRPGTLNGLGSVLYAQGQIDEAMAKWKEAISTDPKFASPYYNMGSACEAQKKLDEAKIYYLKAIEVMPTMSEAYFSLGTILGKEHHYAQAELLLRKAIELAPAGDFVREAKRSLIAIEARFEKNKTKKYNVVQNNK